MKNADPAGVPVGTTTLAGYGGSLAGFILAVYAYTQGDHTAGTLAVIAAGLAFAITQVGRYVQAAIKTKNATAQPAQTAPIAEGAVDGSDHELAASTIIADPFKGKVPKDKGDRRAVRKHAA